jgi:heptosyltransferase-2
MQTNCQNFSGYKPCPYWEKEASCNQTCPQFQPCQGVIAVIHLGALGAVVRSTALLRSLHRKYPQHKLHWITEAPAAALLEFNPWIDQVLTLKTEDLLEAQAFHYQAVFVIDKSVRATGVLRGLHYKEAFGFAADPVTGAILPLNPEAQELWSLGLDDHKKFFENQKSEIQLVHESLNLGPYLREGYEVPLRATELDEAQARSRLWRINSDQPVIGINTGCSPTLPFKKWSVNYHRKLIEALLQRGHRNLVLLGGGPEDADRNQQISSELSVTQSQTQKGLRDGLISTEACDLVISGDSLGMHMAIARQKFVVAWFGPSCAQEIDLYDRGIALRSELSCSPCWKRSCKQKILCYDTMDLEKVIRAIETGVEWHLQHQRFWSCKQPSLETSSLESPF